MKKITILLLIIVGTNLSSLKAQQTTFDESGFNIGIDFGINGTFIIHQQTYGLTRLMPYTPSIRIAAGALIGYNFSPNAGIAIGAGIADAGQNYSDIESGVTYTKSVTLNYIQIPIMFKYMDTDNPSHYFIMGGPQIGFLSSYSMSINGDSYLPKSVNYANGSNITPDIIPLSPKSSASSMFQKTDIGLRLEVGDDIELSDNLYFNVGLVAYIGFTDINIPDMRATFKFGGESYPYKASENFITGIEVGIHYMIK